MSSSEPLRVLSVEDNPETRLLLKHLLKQSYEVVLVSNAKEALSYVESEPFDLLLVDIHLGEGKSGTELLHLLREREPTREVPAIAVTAYSMPGDRADLLEEGFDGYVSKPFTKAELTETIDQVLPAREE
ncbi:MAG: response regulator [Salinibacter sp.]|uniref:response regulator n=1 Tax=Salinibacter sp. TaxID=2065818 RepID=UPI0035D506EE